ncbi:MAG: tRNA pseudouridine(38-40) synthase TruA [Candidatus Adiutrix intracellularis]|jgi:tRNA pseudouridine38-40 synthase|nr:tRNA pseudouridine(38-40) synthase TruA [Candidatus Adiutrix intracellularis]
MIAPKIFKIIIEYDGRNFAGWQKQAAGAGPTIQGVLEAALSRLCAHPVQVHGSGRTDAGVHARGQTASFATPSPRTAEEIISGGNSGLPPEVAILEAKEMPPDFHARFKAIRKVYDYDFAISPIRRPLRLGRAWWVGSKLNWAAVTLALPALLGEQDFKAFQSAGSQTTSSIRTIYRANLTQPETDLVRLTLEGSGFLHHMVRTIAGQLAEIGRGRLPATSLAEIIRARDRRLAGPTAPPDGLYLAQVHYPL